MTKTENAHRTREPRLNPIERPKSLKLKLAYWFTRRLMGKVITPLKVVQARFPESLGLANELIKVQNKISIDPKLKHLIKVYTATLNGCAFCVDIGKASAQQNKIDPVIFEDLLRFDESDHFTDAEKAALSYVDEATRNKHVSEETFENLKRYFSEEDIVQITTLNAIENYYNLMNAPLNIASDHLCEVPNFTR